MTKVDVIINAKHMYTMQGDGVGYLCDHAIAVDGGKIVAIAPKEEIAGAYTAEEVLGADHKVVLPGFIDGHMHTGHAVFRGVAQDIANWMNEGMAPFERIRTNAQKTVGSRLGIAEAIMNGTTTIGEDGMDVEGAIEFIDKVGARGNVSVRVREAAYKLYKPDDLFDYDPAMGERTLNDAIALFDQYDGKDSGRLRINFTPQGCDFLSKELMLKVRDIAKRRGAKIHMHLQQLDQETAQMMMRYGMRSIPWLDQMGYIDPDFIGVHLSSAEPEEVQLVVDRGASMIFCPTSIMHSGVIPPAKQFKDAGGFVALGSDQAAGNNAHNIIGEMKMAALATKAKYRDATAFPCWQVLRMATVEGAKALGIDKVTGSLEVGKDADIILIDTLYPNLTPVMTVPMRTFVPNLVYAGQGREVDTVLVQGKCLVKDKKPVTFNVLELIADAQGEAEKVGVAAEKEFKQVNGANARYMAEGKL